MNLKPLKSIALSALAAVSTAHAGLFVYEPFDYPAGSNINTHLSGGLGFADGWAPAQQGGVLTVYDETAETEINDNAGGELAWDGVVDNLPTLPAEGSRFVASGRNGTADRITAIRTLSGSAGELAGGDGILWASVVWHMKGSNFGRHIGFALGTDGLSNRSRNVDTSGNFGSGDGDAIGVGGEINTLAVTPVIFDEGAIAVRTTDGATNVATAEDNIVVLKFEFAGGAGEDTVTAYRFTESDELSEADFDLNAVSASAAIDEDSLNILSFSQSRGQEAIDEIRLGDSLGDVTTGTTASTVPFNITALDYSPDDEQITLNWNAEAGAQYTIFYDRNPDNLQVGDTNAGDLGDGFSDNDEGGVDLDPAEGKITVEVTNVDTEAEDLFFSVHKN